MMMRRLVNERCDRERNDDGILSAEYGALDPYRRADAPDREVDDHDHVRGGHQPYEDLGESCPRADDAEDVAAGQGDVPDVDQETDHQRKDSHGEADHWGDRGAHPDVWCTGVGAPPVQLGITDCHQQHANPAHQDDQGRGEPGQG
jgi:hypothetical protein